MVFIGKNYLIYENIEK